MSRMFALTRRVAVWMTAVVLLVLFAESSSGLASAEQIHGHPVMMLSTTKEDPSQKSADGKPIDTSTWIREIFRQHVLMVAREEFGFVTRDVTLGEPVDRNSPECFHLRVVSFEDHPVELTLRRGDQVIYEGKAVEAECHVLKQFRDLPKYSLNMRESIATALKAAGYAHQALPAGNLEALPQEIEDLLKRMNFVSQYAAVRRLHQMMQEHGESPAILGGLARGYANLSQLTQPLLDMRHRAFGARALLYANRLADRVPDSPVGYWHRAYTFLSLGYPRAAQEELNDARTNTKDNPTEPQWLKLIPLYVDYRFKEFEKLVQDEKYEYRETAALLWFIASRMTSSPAFTIETGLKARKVIPHSQRLIAGLFDTAGVAMNHEISFAGAQALSATIDEHLTEIADLPESITSKPKQKDGEESDEADQDDESFGFTQLKPITQLLQTAGKQDHQEPSFYVLESTLRAWDLQHLFQRAHFLRGYLGIDATDFVDSTKALVKDDPYGAFYAALAYSNYSPAENANALTQDIQHVELNYCSIGYDALRQLPSTAKSKDGTLYDYVLISWRDAGDLEETCRKRINGFDYSEWTARRDLAKWLKKLSLNSPMCYSEQILLDWDNIKDQAVDWEAKYSEYPCLHFAMSRVLKPRGELDQAIEHYHRYLDLVQDPRGYIGMAEAMYMKDRTSDEWISILEKAMHCEDYFLSHSDAAQRAASTLMRDGRYEDALPWAERAAESGSGGGLMSLLEALTGTGDYVKAEYVCMTASKRYQDGNWYQWCMATGKGNLKAAWKFEKERIKERYLPGAPEAELIFALHDSMTGNNTRALETLVRMSKNRPADQEPDTWTDTLTFVIAAREGKLEICDPILKSYKESPKPLDYFPAMADILTQLREASDKKAVDPGMIPALSEKYPRMKETSWDIYLPQFVGYVEWTVGNKEQAVEHWKIPARHGSESCRMLAWKWLRDAGVDPIHLEDRSFREPFLREPIKLPEKTQ